MKVVLTEKPSVARDIAAFLGAKTKKDGYFEGNGYQVTWAFGHLVSLKEPEDYNPSLKRWSLATLPIVPENFELKLINQGTSAKQFKIIQNLFQRGENLICATDAGREGELIFRYILSLSQCTHKPFQRLWLTSLTDEAIGKAFGALHPGVDFDPLYFAAKCRSESDWIVGLNASRNFTVRYGKGSFLWSVGRVQTPVLAMICERDDEIRSFIPSPFWELKTSYRSTVFKYKDRFLQEMLAQAKLAEVKDHPFVITKIDKKPEKQQPPFLYDLTELQKEMNRKHGYSAQETLELAQSLYEGKLISYPRTDSKFLGSDMKKEIPKILTNLAQKWTEEMSPLNLEELSFTSRIINDKKTTDHHAIIPTGKIPQNLSFQAEKVFQSIVFRLIAAFYPNCQKEVTSVEGVSNHVVFQAKGSRVLTPGWTALYKEEEKKEEEQDLPLFAVGETGPHEPFLKAGKTEPPKHYTEATLLVAMETAGKTIEDEVLKEAMKQKGLGTPATRASIIETLLKRDYICRDKKNLKVTDLGRYLIVLIQDPQLKSPELTGEWEHKLKEIEEGRLEPTIFMNQIVEYTKQFIHHNIRISPNEFGPCPLCRKTVILGKKGYGCSNWKGGCKFVLWKDHPHIKLEPFHVRELLQRKILEHNERIFYIAKTGSLLDFPKPLPKEKKFRKRDSSDKR